jgi:hypothetical protein
MRIAEIGGAMLKFVMARPTNMVLDAKPKRRYL